MMKVKKGIILAGGSGSRLYPLTVAANKQLLPIYDKPVIYYPLTTLMLAGIQDILIISTPRDLPALEGLLGDGSQFGLSLSYVPQEKPNGLPEAFILGEQFIKSDPVAMILGDNFFHGHGLSEAVFDATQNITGAHIFTYTVDDPQRYGIAVLDEEGKVAHIEEKPDRPKSNLAVTGLYYFDGTVSERARKLKPSQRGELEIVDLIKSYVNENKVSVTQLGRGYVWFDGGTPKSLLDASQYVEVIQSRQGINIASPEEVAWRMGFINVDHLRNTLITMPKSKYKDYLSKLATS
jgi:glucose-1-phosphate thymidylyltransferase